MRKLFNEVQAIINRINFEDIWNGFSKFKFALYDDSSAYFSDGSIPINNCFLGNTAIEYNGDFVAIWKINNPLEEDAELLASNLVHEMFHAFQRSKGENRFPNDLTMLNYPETVENLKIKHLENQLLAKAYLAENTDEKKELLNKFMSIRKYRSDLIGDIINQEFLTETIEGMAEYAGCKVLQQISNEKYNARIQEYIENLMAVDNRFFNHRRMLYYSGTIFCLLMASARINFWHEVGKINTPLFRIISDSVNAEEPSLDEDNSELLFNLNKHIHNKKTIFNDFLQTHNEAITEDYMICGYDPMNMLKMDNRILCSHFIMLTNEKLNEPLFIKGPVMLLLKKDSNNQVWSLIK